MNIASSAPRAITLEAYADLFDASEITSTLDLGSTMVHCAHHPVHGPVMLVNTAGEKQAVLYLSQDDRRAALHLS